MIKAPEFLASKPPTSIRTAIVSGEEPFLRELSIAKLRAGFPPDLEVVSFEGPEKDTDASPPLKDILDDLRTQDLFGAEKLIHVRRADKWVSAHKEALVRFLSAKEAIHALILEGRALVPKSTKAAAKKTSSGLEGVVDLVVSCEPPYDAPFLGRGAAWDSPLSKWIQSRAQIYGKRITLQDAYTLHRLAGTALRELDSELAKLAVYVRERPLITADDIEHVIGAGRLAAIHDLAEVIVRRDLSLALENSDQLFELGFQDFGGRHVRDPAAIAITLVAAIDGRLRKVARVKELMAQGSSFEDALSEVKHPAFFADRLRAQVAAFGDDASLPRAIQGLVSLDRDLKSTGGGPRVLLERYLVECVASVPGKKTAWRR